ncbi:MAG: NaeI family type II restriction endonuclease [Verrucomicrobia bacterium]|nr:NaeI family type II restriction endonuclease [Verrucomicrobiota bacterium]
MSSQAVNDPELEKTVAEFHAIDPGGTRTARVLRDTLDQLYDGQRTGRYAWNQLFKTEKTHCGTLVEINLHREFKFEDGESMDYKIAGVDVDCKYSQRIGGWMIPPEAIGHLCLVISAEDTKDPKWSMGLVRTTPSLLNLGNNRDRKATLNEEGRNTITWLFKEMPLPPNALLQLDVKAVDRIMSMTSGQKRVNELFRTALAMRISRAVVATVAQQDDYMKRVRSNGGARTCLKAEGIIILGQYKSHAAVARALGAPEPGPGESVSVRVALVKASGDGVARIDGRLWKIADASDPVVAAPNLPRI